MFYLAYYFDNKVAKTNLKLKSQYNFKTKLLSDIRLNSYNGSWYITV